LIKNAIYKKIKIKNSEKKILNAFPSAFFLYEALAIPIVT